MTGFEWVPTAVGVLVAVISVVGAIILRKVAPPITVQDLWEENRKMRADIDVLSTKQHDNEARGEALVRWLQKIANSWRGPEAFPMPDDSDLQLLDVTIPRITTRRNLK